MPSKRTNDSVDRILEDLNRRQAEDNVRAGANEQRVNEILRNMGRAELRRGSSAAASGQPRMARHTAQSAESEADRILREVMAEEGLSFTTGMPLSQVKPQEIKTEPKQESPKAAKQRPAPEKPVYRREEPPVQTVPEPRRPVQTELPKAAEKELPKTVQKPPVQSAMPKQEQKAPLDGTDAASNSTTNLDVKKFMVQALDEESASNTDEVRARAHQFQQFFQEAAYVVPDENGHLPPEKTGRGGDSAQFTPIHVSLGKRSSDEENEEETERPRRSGGWFSRLFGKRSARQEEPLEEEEPTRPEEYKEEYKKEQESGFEQAEADDLLVEPVEQEPERRPVQTVRPLESPADLGVSTTPVQEPVAEETLNTLASLAMIRNAIEAEKQAKERRTAGVLPTGELQLMPLESETETEGLPLDEWAPQAEAQDELQDEPQDELEEPTKERIPVSAPKKKPDTVEFTPGRRSAPTKPESAPRPHGEPIGEPILQAKVELTSAEEQAPVPETPAAPDAVTGTGSYVYRRDGAVSQVLPKEDAAEETRSSFSIHMDAIRPEVLRQPRRPKTSAEQQSEQPQKQQTQAQPARKPVQTSEFVSNIAQAINSAAEEPPVQTGTTGRIDLSETGRKFATAVQQLTHTGEINRTEGGQTGKTILGMKLGGKPGDETAKGAAAPFEAAAQPEMQDYEHAADAPAVRAALDKKVLYHGISTIVCAVSALVMFYLGTAVSGSVLPMPAALDPLTSPGALMGVCLLLLAVCAGLCWRNLRGGLLGLRGRPTPDSMPALAVLAAMLQLLLFLFNEKSYDPSRFFLFAGPAALLLACHAAGRTMEARTVRANFDIVSAGVDHAAAYRLKDAGVVRTITGGLGEPRPFVLVSRPTGLLKGFLAGSYSQHTSDRTQQRFAWILGGASVFALLFDLIFKRDVGLAFSAMAGVLCLGAPLAGTLMSALPAHMMQASAARVGAVIPGWKDIRQLGRANVIQITSRDLFPGGCVQLFGIRTVRQERIDMAIVYAASILVESCPTLRDVFLRMLGGDRRLLHKVDELQTEPGMGFVGWVDGSRMLVGSRALLEKYGVQPPPIEYEKRNTAKNQKAIYLAVSSNLIGMFIVGYARDEDTALVLETLRRRGLSLLVSSDDFNCDVELVESVYSLPTGSVKVLSHEEVQAMAPATAWLPESEGCMLHLGSFVSFVGGMEAAAGAAESERRSTVVLAATVLVGGIFGLVVAILGNLAALPLPAMLLYQVAWCVLTLIFPLLQKY